MKKQYVTESRTYFSPSVNVFVMQEADLICTSGEVEIGTKWDEAWDQQ